MSEPVSDGRARFDAAAAGSPFLSYRDDSGRQHIVPLPGSPSALTIGRDAAADVCLSWDGEVSRIHAELHHVGGHWVVSDEGLSRNGTFVNGDRLSGRRRLSDRDTIRAGSTIIAFNASAQQQLRPTVTAKDFPASVGLSAGQRRVLVALCRPYKFGNPYSTPATNQQIAEELFLSVDAVKTHLRSIFSKFDLDGVPQNQKRARLAELAMRLGLISPADL
jgi:hypothetical protein